MHRGQRTCCALLLLVLTGVIINVPAKVSACRVRASVHVVIVIM